MLADLDATLPTAASTGRQPTLTEMLSASGIERVPRHDLENEFEVGEWKDFLPVGFECPIPRGSFG